MPQMLVLVGSDGGKASVPRAIATEASYVLRDLLDCQSLLDGVVAEDSGSASTDGGGNNNNHNNNSGTPAAANPIDLMDLFPTAGATPAPSNSNNKSNDNHTSAASTPAAAPASVELPFPYCPGAILELVCRHMTYRFRLSDFGSEDGRPRVYPTRARAIPRPMLQPLADYLDASDRQFVADWDERMAAAVLKVAVLLNYEELQQLAAAKMASLLADKSVDEIRALLGLENDFSPAEEIELAKELKS